MTCDALNAKWNDWVLGYGPDTQNSFMEWLGMDNPNWRKMLLTLVGGVVGLILAISGLMMLRYRSPPKDRASILYGRFVRKTGLQRRTGETEQQFALRAAAEGAVADEAATSVTGAYLNARYGPPDEQALMRLRSAIDAIA